MPPRRKPISTKQRKAELQHKRAVKRGDIEPDLKKAPPRPKKGRRGPADPNAPDDKNREQNAETVRRLQSAFVKLDKAYLEETKELAGRLALERPLPAARSVFSEELLTTSDGGEENGKAKAKETRSLTCPRRPKWRFDMTKNEVEKNEEGVHRKWLAEMDAIVEDWRREDEAEDEEEVNEDEVLQERTAMPRPPTYFERNLEVWRQLWRVTEISQIVLVLLDARCPPVHFPPTLAAYLATYTSRDKLRVVLVLTKVDVAGPARADAWAAYLREKHPGVRVVQVEAYAREGLAEQGEQKAGRRTHDPCLPGRFRAELVQAIREAHAELLMPPERIRGDEEKVARWKPAVRREVDWERVISARGGQVGSAVGGAAAPRTKGSEPGEDDEDEDDEREDEGERPEPEFLTVGLIGQPNVGKSSLLNALFGQIKVRASRTPGKTKHFQTLFWTPDVRLVDCPGLVVPQLERMELQVLTGVLPISRVSAVPACIHYAAQLLPLEKTLGLTHPNRLEGGDGGVQDKRTWREGMRDSKDGKGKEDVWTAMDVLTAYAAKKGWVTAKAGRPDVMRGGNAILRALAEAKTRWGFWPPGHGAPDNDGNGIWIEGGDEEDSEESDEGAESESGQAEDKEDTEEGRRVRFEEGESAEESSEESSEEEPASQPVRGRYAGLFVDEPEEEEAV